MRESKIELSLGARTTKHQSHSIFKPVSVAFDSSHVGPGGVLDIEDEFGTKTLIKFIQPFPVLAEYVKTEIVSVN